MSIYMNPEYELEDLHKALKWAVVTSQEACPFCAVLVLPMYQMASYMRLFSHHDVTLIAKLRKHTFAFMPPDQWETDELPDPGALPTAEFPVLIVEVANQPGREQYTRRNSGTTTADSSLLHKPSAGGGRSRTRARATSERLFQVSNLPPVSRQDRLVAVGPGL
jgi:hypothetical protein